MKTSLLILALVLPFTAQAAPKAAECPANTRQISTCTELSEDQASSSIAICVPGSDPIPPKDIDGEVVFVDTTNEPAEVLQSKAIIRKDERGINVNFKSEKDGIEFLLVSDKDGVAVLMFESQAGFGSLDYECK